MITRFKRYLYRASIFKMWTYYKSGMKILISKSSTITVAKRGFLSVEKELINRSAFKKRSSCNIWLAGDLVIDTLWIADVIIAVHPGARLVIGNCFMNDGTYLECESNITIGDNVLIGRNVTIRDSDGHDHGDAFGKRERCLPVEIGNSVWVGSNVLIQKGGTYW